jgi:prepilin peptidase CpaA
MINPFNSDLLYVGSALICAGIAAIFDVRSRRIPNFISGPAILFGIYIHFTLGGYKEAASSVLAGLLCGAVFLIFFLAGGMGAGDVKLMIAVGCLGGISHTAFLLVFTALSGGVLAVGLAFQRGRLKEMLVNVGTLAVHHQHEGLRPHPEINVANSQSLRLPYALAIAAGCASTFWLLVS